MSDKPKVFANGLIFKRKDNAPEFVIGNLSVAVDSFKDFIEENANNGWVNLVIKKSQKGTYYIEIDDWKKRED